MKALNSCYFIVINMYYRVKVDFGIKNEKPIVYRRIPIEKSIAESQKIPHEIVYDLALKGTGELLRIRRAENEDTYPDYNSVPAGHTNVIKHEEKLVCESSWQAAERELWEETKVKSKKTIQIFKEKLIYDASKGHFGLAFVMLVDKDSKPLYNEEINPEKSEFEPPELILERLEKEKFTPASRDILSEFLKEYQTKQKLEDLYYSILQS